MKRNHVFILFLIAGSVLLIVILNQHQASKVIAQRVSPHKPQVDFNSSVLQSKQSSPDEKKTHEFKRHEPSCSEKMLTKISGKCDEACLVRYLKNKDPELTQYIEQEGFISKMDFENPKMNFKTKLGRWYYALNGLSDEESVKVLRLLSKEDKDNSFPAIFLASKVPDKEEGLEILKEALKRPQYRSYVTDMRKRLMKLTVHHPELYARALLYAEIDIQPAFYSEFMNAGKFGNKLKLEVGRMMIRETSGFDGKNFLVALNPNEYIWAHGFIYEADKNEAEKLEPLTAIVEKEIEDFPITSHASCNEKEFELIRLDIMERLKDVP